MRRITLFFLLLFITTSSLFSARLKREKIDLNLSYQINIEDTVDNVYIPKDFSDAFRTLDGMLSKEQRDSIRAMSNGQFLNGAHYGLGMWIRNNWGLWGDSRFKGYLIRILNIRKELAHADILSDYVLSGYYEYLTDKKFSIKEYEKSIRIK